MISADNIQRGSIISDDNKVLAKTLDKTQRVYSFETSLEPLIGYVNSKLEGKIGIEKYAQDPLSQGLDVKLTINLGLQQQIESILDEGKLLYEADEIMAAVIEGSTGKVVAMASSNRYDPTHITKKDIPSLNQKFSEYPYEPGSIIKPLTLAIALDHNVVKPLTVFNTYGGRMQIGEKRFITDDQKFDTLTATDIILHSSNIGISQIAWRLTGKEFKDGLMKFGLGTPSGIDLPRDLSGSLKSFEQLDTKMHRANSSYGYGMTATLTQFLKAYSVFNNNGLAVTPYLMESDRGKKENSIYVISKKSATQIYDILVENVRRGTAKNAHFDGLEIGGKTGTAHIAKNGRYVREYHSSFYGFANDDKEHKYTVGVVVIRAKAKYAYFSSQSAVPVFRKIVEALTESNYLKPSIVE